MNMKSNVPQLDKRNYKQVVEQALKLAGFYFSPPQWNGVQWESILKEPVDKDDPGYRLLEIFSRMMELLIRRLNKIPDKNFLSFLEMIGVEQKAGNPAEVPVTFLPAKSAVKGGDVPAGTQVATTQTDTADAQVFETRNAFFATPAKLIKVVNVTPGTDAYSSLELSPLPPALEDLEDSTRPLTAFDSHNGSLSPIDHVLYIGSETLFGREEARNLELEIFLSRGNKEILNKTNLKWQTYNKEKKAWEDIEDDNISYSYYSDSNLLRITIKNFRGTGKSEINGIEDFWIACFFIGKFTADIEKLEISGILGNVLPPWSEEEFTTKIEKAFSNNTPIDPTKPIYPFGQRPQYGDAFYIGSKQAFSPNTESISLKFKIHPYSDDDLKEIYSGLKEVTGKKVTVKTDIQWEYLGENGVWQPFAIASTPFSHSITASKNEDNVGIVRPKDKDDVNRNGTFFGNGTSSDIKITLSNFNNIALNKVNKEESYWLRAVIKSFNPYGKDAWIESTGNTEKPFTVIGPTFIPPIIEEMDISYNYKATPVFVDSIQTKNNFQFKILEAEEHFTPFIHITSQILGNNRNFFAKEPAIYMGFDREFGDSYISMFILLEETLSASGYALEQGNPQITWEYAAAGNTWRPLDINDNTADLTGSGTIAFTGPSDSIKTLLFKTLFQEEAIPASELYWYRARLNKGHYDYPPVIKDIYLNTVMADNRVVTRQDQVIGSGNGTANQQLSLVRVPLISGQLWVREGEKPGEDEIKDILQDFHSLGEYDDIEEVDIIEEIETTTGKEENWVQWLKVPNFLASGPRSRHFTLDAVNGWITFGDNKNGLIPPAGKDNVIIRESCTGGGEAANSAAAPLAVKVLKSSLPYVDKVFNIQPAVGGSNPWTLEQTREFGPQAIKHRQRAVTVEDYQWMVLQQFSQVARVKCIPTGIPAPGGAIYFKPGAVTVIVVPKTNAPKPQPSKSLLKNIRDYLQKKVMGTIVEEIHVIGPGFEKININAHVVPQKPEESSIVERRIIKTLEAFFHPLSGGEKGEGWEFGRNVYISEIYAVIERTEGVDCVKNASFTGKPHVENIEIGSNSLCYSGSHDIQMEMS